jgi:alpha-tubulin suppressor-like RCC1 family protein
VCNDSTVNAWGYNHNGELGIGDTTSRNTSVPVHGPGNVGFLGGIIAIATGGNPLAGISHSLALKNDGTVWSWGYNLYAQLGTGDTIARWTPVQVHGPGNVGFLTGITSIAGGGYHSFALKNDGTVWAWGRNNHGQLGVGDTIGRSTPVQVSGLTNVIAIAGNGWTHCLALKSDSTVWAWGQNYFGQLGVGDTTDRWLPTQVSGLTGIVAIAEGAGHSLALKKDGTVWAWGYNIFGQLGDSTTIDKHSPVKVNNLSGVIAIAGGAAHSLALKNNGTVWTWEFNNLGQLGDSTTTDKYTPVQVSAFSGAVAISGGGGHSLAMKNDGTLWTWGFNSNGQLGNGTFNGSVVPVQVTGLCSGSGVNEITEQLFISVYPNPFSSSTTLQSKNPLHNATLTIYNSLGQTVKQIKKISGQTVTLSRDNLPSVLYFIRLTQDNKTFVTEKLVITDY